MQMQGFFNEHFDNAEAEADCKECGLYKDCESPQMKPSGKGKMGIMVLGEAPGETEDREGEQWVGRAGNLLQEFLAEFDISLKRDCRKHNAVCCRPMDAKGNNRTPTNTEVMLCRKNVVSAIKDFKPKAIFLMGGSAVDSFFMEDRIVSSLGISHLRGRAIPYHKYRCWVFPMFHPSFILRNNDNKARRIFYKDLKNAIKHFEDPLPDTTFMEKVKILTQREDIESLLRKVRDEKPIITFDYETNALSPYRDDPKIRCISFQYVDKKTAYAFPYQYQNEDKPSKLTAKLWGDILHSNEIGKVMQNGKFESHWTKEVIGTTVRGWLWDTMINTHILEGPTIGGLTGINGLKEQTYLRWGIEYADDIAQYMNKTDSTGQNSLHKAPLPLLLKYCAMDSLVTTKLYHEQKLEFDPFLTKGRKFLHNGLIALYKVEHDGIRVNEEYYEKEELRLTKKADKLKETLLESKEAVKFKKKYGREIKLSSSDDLRILFYEILKMKPIKFTATTESNEDESDRTASVDKSVMTELNSDFTNQLIAWRKILKIRDTYLSQFKRYAYEGKLHPTNNLHIARTYRSSASNPNSQNIPNRDPEAEKSVRSGVVPSKGNFLQEVDYKTMEIRILVSLTHDPAMLEYIRSGNDMHLDEGVKIFGGPVELISKDMRFNVKGGWSFAEVYGSYWENCAKHIWEIIDKVKNAKDETLREHIAQHLKIKTLAKYANHLHDCEDEFWKKYRMTKRWQTNILKFYEKHSYVEMPFGFRRGGLLSRNKIINTPVQGTAFHCLLWSLIRLVKYELKPFKSKIIGQIHDSLIMDMYPPEEQEVNKIVKRVMCKDVREANPFITVPLDIDIKRSEVNGSWYMKKEK